jgi:plasmid stabilization system protein ParE
MKLVLEESFLDRLDRQLDFIALDSTPRARKFGAALMKAVRQIPANPMLFRKSVYFDDPNIRDMVFKGYTVVFRVTDEAIEVFGLVNQQLRPTDGDK